MEGWIRIWSDLDCSKKIKKILQYRIRVIFGGLDPDLVGSRLLKKIELCLQYRIWVIFHGLDPDPNLNPGFSLS